MRYVNYLSASVALAVVLASCSGSEEKTTVQTTNFEEQLMAVLPVLQENNTLKVMQYTAADTKGEPNLCFSFTTRGNSVSDHAAQGAEVPSIENQLARLLPALGDKYAMKVQYNGPTNDLFFCLMPRQDAIGTN